MKNLIVRSVTGFLFVVIMVTCFLRAEAMIFLFTLITTMTIWEFCGLVNEIEGVSVNRFICSAAGGFFFLAMAGFRTGITPATIFVPYLITLVYLIISELYAKNANPVNNWAYTMFSQLYIALPFSLISVVAFQPDVASGGMTYYWLMPLSIYIFLWVNDSGAYLTGSLLGKHKLFPRISPGKSWEGSVGGAVLVLIAAAIVSHIANPGSTQSGLTLCEWLGLGLVVVVFGTWGDLVESLFKRTLGIKDSGTILPGHGGMLDRFDSSLMAIPAAVIYLFTLTLF